MDGGIDFADLQNREVDFSSADAHPEHARLLSELDRKSQARKIAVPTDDLKVRVMLREHGEPVTLFGERFEDRRDRLRVVLSRLQQARGGEQMEVESESDDSDEDKEEEFFTEGSADLKRARREIAEFSLPRAKRRLARQRTESTLPLGRLMDVRKAVFADLRTFTNLGSQIGDTRALGTLRFAPDARRLLTSSWTGQVKLWDVPSCKEVRSYNAHMERVGGLAWHPQATTSLSSAGPNFVTGGADNEVKLWSLDSAEPVRTLSGHTARVCRVAYHPSGCFVGSASYDGSWRLWDVEKGEELLLQEGHSKEVYAIDFQEDGSLCCTGGLDAIGRVWDLRSGRTAMVLDGHVRDILAIDFSPNGYQIATGSNDDTIRIWDMRALKSIYNIPAHKSAVSDVKFFRTSSGSAFQPAVEVPSAFAKLPVFASQGTNGTKTNGDSNGMDVDSVAAPEVPLSGLFLASSGYDGYVKIWSADDWQIVRQMTSDANGKVMSVDISSDAKFIASSEFSRTFKLWSNPDVDLSGP